jgi:hypothetical protein
MGTTAVRVRPCAGHGEGLAEPAASFFLGFRWRIDCCGVVLPGWLLLGVSILQSFDLERGRIRILPMAAG